MSVIAAFDWIPARIKFASRVQGTPCGILVSAFCGGEGDAHPSAVQPVMTAT